MTTREAWRGDRGSAVSVWVVLIVAAMTLIMGIAVDMSGQIAAKREAGDLAAAAARTAAEQVNTLAYLADGRSTEVVAAHARAAALDYLGAAGATGTVRFDNQTTLIVDVQLPYRPVFLSAFGAQLTVTGTATTRLVRALNGTER